jgi:hypothetical protein
MVVTSFRPGRSYLNAAQWKLLHTTSIYFLWAYHFSAYQVLEGDTFHGKNQ